MALSSSKIACFAMFAVAAIVSVDVQGAELQLRRECKVSGNLVRVLDVAEVLEAEGDDAKLGDIELFPSPKSNERRTLSVRQLQDLLVLRGVNLASHRISGASEVAITSGAAARVKPIRLSGAAARESTIAAQAAILKHLTQVAGASAEWDVVTTPNAVETETLASGEIVHVSGGAAPWVGEQHFDLTIATGSGGKTLRLVATVKVPPSVIVAVRPIARGETIRPDDVMLQSKQIEVSADACSRLEDVVGHEMLRPIAAGEVLEISWLQPPKLVLRGELVTVCAYSAGIKVKTTGRCCADGSEGEVVQVESLGDKSKFLARVSGPQQVEVYARAAATHRVQISR